MAVYVKCRLCPWSARDVDAFAAYALLELHERLVHPGAPHEPED